MKKNIKQIDVIISTIIDYRAKTIKRELLNLEEVEQMDQNKPYEFLNSLYIPALRYDQDAQVIVKIYLNDEDEYVDYTDDPNDIYGEYRNYYTGEVIRPSRKPDAELKLDGFVSPSVIGENETAIDQIRAKELNDINYTITAKLKELV